MERALCTALLDILKDSPAHSKEVMKLMFLVHSRIDYRWGSRAGVQVWLQRVRGAVDIS